MIKAICTYFAIPVILIGIAVMSLNTIAIGAIMAAIALYE